MNGFLKAPAAVPCCASHTMYTSTKPEIANANLCGAGATSAIPQHSPVPPAQDAGAAKKRANFMNTEDPFTSLVHEVVSLFYTGALAGLIIILLGDISYYLVLLQ